ncbi:hypothetical protein [Fictibacillus sp. S7]|uniref:hypothetical protein n=1 Tax=Fictibacillus sp. S7 TaxID=2212476 RepID=UPI0019D6F090|nr:hypothetical protein [Fictibacillus sp. S7]
MSDNPMNNPDKGEESDEPFELSPEDYPNDLASELNETFYHWGAGFINVKHLVILEK